MRINHLALIGAIIVLTGTIVAANFGQFSTLNYVQKQGAQHRALDEANTIAQLIPDLGRLLRTGAPDGAQKEALRTINRHHAVSAVMLFDSSGKIVLPHTGASWMATPDLIAAQANAVLKTLATGQAQVFSLSAHTGEDSPRLLGSAFVPFRDTGGKIAGVVGVYLDLSDMASLFDTEFFKLSVLLTLVFTVAMAALLLAYLFMRRRAKRSGQQADYLARYDQLTGLYNRGGFNARLEEICQKGHSLPAKTAVFYFDLDNFKSINDTRGHRTGDDILRHVGSSVRDCLEPDDLAGRYGGDEFVIVAQTGTLEKAVLLVERLQALIGRPVHTGGTTQLVNASFGIRFGLTPGAPIEDEIHRADLALYQAKMDGRNTYRVFSPELEDRVHRRLKVESAVNRGLEEGLFSLQFQPLIQRATGKCAGFETLLRLKDTDGEPISPAEFVPIAEANGTIRKIGSWVLATAIAEAAHWPEELFVSVNLSARQFDEDNLVDTVQTALTENGFAPGRLELEVTESQLIDNTESVGRQLVELRALGVAISMDDFGTGYSSLGYLWKYGFDKLKIDRSFILGLDADSERVRQILDTIIVLAHRLDMKVTAEGIETEMQAELLSDLSFDQFQGYLYGVPMPAGELPGFILKNHLETHKGADLAARPGDAGGALGAKAPQ